jgi:hypothetical protein
MLIYSTAELRDGRRILMLYQTDISQDDFVRANDAFRAAETPDDPLQEVAPPDLIAVS